MAKWLSLPTLNIFKSTVDIYLLIPDYKLLVPLVYDPGGVELDAGAGLGAGHRPAAVQEPPLGRQLTVPTDALSSNTFDIRS